MDQHTSRLSVLLSLVARVRRIPNLTVILSCREFDYGHDARLTTLKASSVRLGPLPWEAIEPVLKEAGMEPSGWYAEFRETLRVPQHLALFLDQLAGQDARPPFASYQDMLEAVLQRRVLNGPGGPRAVAALHSVSQAMVEDEELWVPVARFDTQREAIVELEAAGFLLREMGGRRLGFRHQTLFDFVRARAFVATGESIAAYALARQGTLFARPTVWSALSYLRGADRAAYGRELKALWDAANLRPHMRDLVREFLAQLANPSDDEARILLPLIGDPAVGARILRTMARSQGWFRRLRPRMRDLMAAEDQRGWAIAWVLRAAISFERDAVLELLAANWSDVVHHPRASRVLDGLEIWDERAVAIAATIVASSQPYEVQTLTQKAARSLPEEAPRILIAKLRATTASLNDQELSRFVEHSGGWYRIGDVMGCAPKAFSLAIWPWVMEAAASLARDDLSGADLYRPDGSHALMNYCGSETVEESRLMPAIRATLTRWASQEPGAFVEFVASQAGDDLMLPHLLLAKGLEMAAHAQPAMVLRYLLADRRRLAVGDWSDPHEQSKRLIAALTPHLDREGFDQLVQAILNFEFHSSWKSAEPKYRFDLSKYNRQHRVEILSAIPESLQLPSLRRFMLEEERALEARPKRQRPTARYVVSRMSADAMAKARDRDILHWFEHVPDSSEWGEPFSKTSGGSIEASRAFGDFAKVHPARALRLMEAFKPGHQERPVAEGLSALSEAKAISPDALCPLITRLHEAGFASQEFRSAAAYALTRAAEPLGGLDDATCELLQSWLSNASVGDVISRHDNNQADEHGARKRPLLWDHGGITVLPGGNYPVLQAIELGLLLRSPPAADAWLAVVERHLDRREDPKVWVALAERLRFLWHAADRSKAVAIIRRLLASVPEVGDSIIGVRLVAWTHTWLPSETVQEAISGLLTSMWNSGALAAGELTALRMLVEPEDGWATVLWDKHLEDAHRGVPTGLDFAIGASHTAAALWTEPRFRDPSTTLRIPTDPSRAIRRKPAGDSGRSQPPVPRHSSHP